MAEKAIAIPGAFPGSFFHARWVLLAVFMLLAFTLPRAASGAQNDGEKGAEFAAAVAGLDGHVKLDTDMGQVTVR